MLKCHKHGSALNPLGEFEQLVLFAVLRLEEEACGVAIHDEIEARTGRGVSPGAIYTTLGRLGARAGHVGRSHTGTGPSGTAPQALCPSTSRRQGTAGSVWQHSGAGGGAAFQIERRGEEPNMIESTYRPLGCLRWLAAVLVRGPNAPFITQDLEEMYARDRSRGASALVAHARYVRYLVASLFSVWRADMSLPRLPRVGWLDVKLACRMLVHYPGLTIVGGLALAIGIPVALVPVHLINALNAPLPFEDGHRIVGLQYWDVQASDSRKPTPYNFERWRAELTSFETLAAARTRRENVISDAGPVEVIRGAEMTASAFAVTRVQPFLGRTLVEADELKTAPPVVVIGHDLWQTQFAGNADVLGRTLRFGRELRTVVGVMPAGFGFPYRDRFWVPLRERAIDYEVGQGPGLLIFGRLRDGVSFEQAQTELTTVGHRIAADHPDTHGRLRPEVAAYTHVATGLRATYDGRIPCCS